MNIDMLLHCCRTMNIDMLLHCCQTMNIDMLLHCQTMNIDMLLLVVKLWILACCYIVFKL